MSEKNSPRPKILDVKEYAMTSMNPKVHHLLKLGTEQMLTGMKLNAIKNFKRILASGLEADKEVLGCIELCLGFLDTSKGSLDSGLEHFQKGLEHFFDRFGIKCELTGVVTANIGSTFIEMEDYIQALDFHKSATTIIENISNTEYIQATLNYNLALVHHKLGNFNMSLEICKKSLEDHLSFCDESDARVGDLFSLIADNLWKMKIFEDSYDFLIKAFNIYKENYGTDHIKMAHALERMAIYHTEIDKSAVKAQKYFKESLDIKKKLLGDHPLVANTYSNMALFFAFQGNISETISCLEKYVIIMQPILEGLTTSTHDPSNATWVASFGRAAMSRFGKNMHFLISQHYNSGNYRRAKECIQLVEGIMPKESLSKQLKVSLSSLKSMVEAFAGNKEKAHTLATRALELIKNEYGPKHPKVIEALFRLGLICQDLGKKDEAIIYLTSASELVQVAENPEHSIIAKIKNELEIQVAALN